MRRYHSPKDYLDAARDPAASPEELRFLASSVYDFVRLAVAEHPHAEADVLVALIPQHIESWNEQRLALALARHPNTPAHGLRVLAERLPAVLNRGRGNDNGLAAGSALCNHPTHRSMRFTRCLPIHVYRQTFGGSLRVRRPALMCFASC